MSQSPVVFESDRRGWAIDCTPPSDGGNQKSNFGVLPSMRLANCM